jgi:hypothetical protein
MKYKCNGYFYFNDLNFIYLWHFAYFLVDVHDIGLLR